MGNLEIKGNQDTGNVYFAPGLVKSIQKEKESVWAIHTYQGEENTYSVVLKDGTRLSYSKQMGSNQARVETNGKTIMFKGIDGIVVDETEKDDKYEFRGCRGYVNVYDENDSSDYDSLIIQNRKLANGTVQESRMYIIKDKNVKLNKTSYDFVNDVWSQRQAEKAAAKRK